ncbi:hypothetical protein [Streptomyces sp. NPDC102282]|uniref:hypothetical protein n=1 Tax=Streptomyces sp. NPDC102282 TaxID=3366154 RepID=UPI003811D733
MEIYSPLPGGICLPYPYYPLPQFRLPKAVTDAVRTSGQWVTDAAHRFARPLRASLYGTTGVVSAVGTTLFGIDPIEAASFGLNVTAALFAVAPLPGKASHATDTQSAAAPTGSTIKQACPPAGFQGTDEHRRWKRAARRFVQQHHRHQDPAFRAEA